MSLKLFDTKDAVPESLRDSAVETKEGKWAVSDVPGLKANADRLLDEKKKVEQKLDDLSKALGGLTAEQVAKIREDAKKAEDEADRKTGDIDKIVEKRLAEQRTELQKQIDDLKPFREKYETREVELDIRNYATKGGVNTEDLEFVVGLTAGKRVKFDQKTGKTVVVDKDGDVMNTTVEKFFAEGYKTEAPKFYKPAGGAGGGAGGANGGGGGGGSGPATFTDSNAFIRDLDKIAKGEVKVVAG